MFWSRDASLLSPVLFSCWQKHSFFPMHSDNNVAIIFLDEKMFQHSFSVLTLQRGKSSVLRFKQKSLDNLPRSHLSCQSIKKINKESFLLDIYNIFFFAVWILRVINCFLEDDEIFFLKLTCNK